MLPFENFRHTIRRDTFSHMPRGIGAAKMGIEILQYLFDEEIGDPIEKEDEAIPIWGNHKRWMRFLARAASYSIYIFQIDKTLSKSFEEIVTILRTCNVVINIVVPKKTQSICLWRDLWRHKVYAHSSYSDPRGDIENVQVTSLAYLSGNFKIMSPEAGCQLGGGYACTDSLQSSLMLQNFLNPIGIASDHVEVLEYFKAWEGVFSDIFLKIDPRDIEQKINKTDRYKEFRIR